MNPSLRGYSHESQGKGGLAEGAAHDDERLAQDRQEAGPDSSIITLQQDPVDVSPESGLDAKFDDYKVGNQENLRQVRRNSTENQIILPL